MAFVHCHSCDFSQDDFWSKSYNPIRILLHWEKRLLQDNLDEPFTDDGGFIKEHGNISLREFLAKNLENHAQRIRDMKWRTTEEFKKSNPKWICPNCGNPLDVD